MGTYNLTYTETAKRNIIEIAGYISHELKAPESARKLVAKLMQAAADITAFPYAHSIHQMPQNEEPLKHEYRKILVDNYFVFYYVDETQSLIVVSAVIYARRRLPEQLRKAECSDKPQNQ